jgi:carbamoyl-phosphate synthase large subunit
MNNTASFELQACRAMKEEGYTVVIINANRAAIMTEPGLADRTDIEPITPQKVERVLAECRRACGC